MNQNLFSLARRVIYLGLYFVDTVFQRKALITILCYHSIAQSSWFHSVMLKDFKKQVDYLVKNDQVIELHDIKAFLDGRFDPKKPSFAITFDDGYADIIQTRAYLKGKGIRPTVFVLSQPKKVDRTEVATDLKFLTKKDLIALTKDGWGIGCHSATHPDFDGLGGNRLKEETRGARQKLQKDLQIKITAFAYPRGRYNKNTHRAVAAAGFDLALSMDDGFITRKSDPYALPKVAINGSHSFEEFKASFSPSVVTFRKLVKKTFLNKYL